MINVMLILNVIVTKYLKALAGSLQCDYFNLINAKRKNKLLRYSKKMFYTIMYFK